MAHYINEINIYRSEKDMRKIKLNKPGKGPKPGKGKPPLPPWPPLDLPDPPETGWNIGADESPN